MYAIASLAMGGDWSFVSCCSIESRVKVLSFLKFTQQQTNKQNKRNKPKGTSKSFKWTGAFCFMQEITPVDEGFTRVRFRV